MPRQSKYADADFYTPGEASDLVNEMFRDAAPVKRAIRVIDHRLGGSWSRHQGVYSGDPFDVFQEFIRRLLEPEKAPSRIRWFRSPRPEPLFYYKLGKWVSEALRLDQRRSGRERGLLDGEDWDKLKHQSFELDPEQALLFLEALQKAEGDRLRSASNLRNQAQAAAARGDPLMNRYLKLRELGASTPELLESLAITGTQLESLKKKERRWKAGAFHPASAELGDTQ